MTLAIQAPPGVRKYWTTGQVAALLCCSGRTVLEMCNTGKLPCLRLPSRNLDRRIHREDLRRFLHEFGYVHEVRVLDGGVSALLVGVDTPLAESLDDHLPDSLPLYRVDTAFAAGALWHELRPLAVVLDVGALGRGGVAEAAAFLRAQDAPPALVALLPEDCPVNGEATEWGLHGLLSRPLQPRRLADVLLAIAEGR